jgi:hypothetical protein
MPPLFVKKIWSLNPNLYRYIPIEKALSDYIIYSESITLLNKEDLMAPSRVAKNFKQWLRTEI